MNCGLTWLLEWFNAVHVIKQYIRVIFAYLDYRKSFNISHEMPFSSSTLTHLLGCVILQMNGFVECWFVRNSLFLDMQYHCSSTYFQAYRNPSCCFWHALFCPSTFALSGCENKNFLLSFHGCNYIRNCTGLCFSSLQWQKACKRNAM